MKTKLFKIKKDASKYEHCVRSLKGGILIRSCRQLFPYVSGQSRQLRALQIHIRVSEPEFCPRQPNSGYSHQLLGLYRHQPEVEEPIQLCHVGYIPAKEIHALAVRVMKSLKKYGRLVSQEVFQLPIPRPSPVSAVQPCFLFLLNCL